MCSDEDSLDRNSDSEAFPDSELDSRSDPDDEFSSWNEEIEFSPSEKRLIEEATEDIFVVEMDRHFVPILTQRDEDWEETFMNFFE